MTGRHTSPTFLDMVQAPRGLRRKGRAVIRALTVTAALAVVAFGVAPAVSSRDVDWAPLGIGFALGIALAIGLWVAMQALRARPLAH